MAVYSFTRATFTPTLAQLQCESQFLRNLTLSLI